MGLFDTDFQPLIDGISKQFNTAMGTTATASAPANQDFSQLGRGAWQDFSKLGGGVQDFSTFGGQAAPGGFDWGKFGTTTPDFSSVYDPIQGYQNRRAAIAAKAAEQKGNKTAVEGGPLGGAPTAADNQGLTAQSIDAWIAKTRPNSPMQGLGASILTQANAAGVSVPLLLGILLKEAELGTTAGAGNNVSGLKTTDGSGFDQSGSVAEAIGKAITNLNTPMYKGKSLEEQVGNWYAGPAAWAQWGTDATDVPGNGKSPNGTVGDYVNLVRGVYAGLGVGRGSQGMPVGKAGRALPVAGMNSRVTLHHGSQEGVGATDIFAAEGTPVAAVEGGQVLSAQYDEIGGYNVMIKAPSGLTFYYAHLQGQPLVRAGQTIAAGTRLGGVGDTGNAKGTGAHLHLGIGYGIQSGTGPTGGAGINFNAVDYLNGILDGKW